MSSTLLLESVDIEALVPDAFGAYRNIFREAIGVFLQRLPPARLDTILLLQANLPTSTSSAERLIALLRSCPSLHKFGQLVARRRDLSDELRGLLQRLETMRGETLPTSLRKALESQLDEAYPEHEIRIAPRACAEASVAIVVPIEWQFPADIARQGGVIKVLKPGVEAQLEQELDALCEVSDYLDAHASRGRIPPIGYRAIFDDVRRLLVHEVDLVNERRNLEEAGEIFANSPQVHVPRLLPFCTPRILAMERVEGVKVTASPADAVGRAALAQVIVRALIADVLFSPRESSLFHADPHGGNLFAAADGRLAILDWSLTGRLSRDDRRGIVQIIAGALTLDPARIARAISGLGIAPTDALQFGGVIEAAIDRIVAGEIPGLRWMVRLIDGVGACSARVPANLLLLRKALLLVDGVLGDLAPAFLADASLVGAAIEAFSHDWLERFGAAFGANAARTQLSNADLAELTMSLPLAASRFWSRALSASGGRR